MTSNQSPQPPEYSAWFESYKKVTGKDIDDLKDFKISDIIRYFNTVECAMSFMLMLEHTMCPGINEEHVEVIAAMNTIKDYLEAKRKGE